MNHIPSPLRILPAILIAASSCMPRQEAPSRGRNGAQAALVITTDYESGAYATIDLGDRSVQADIATIHPDAVCRHDRVIGVPFIINRWGSDAIAVPNPDKGWRIDREYSVEAGTNPQDIASVSPERAYVARLNTPDLLVVHPMSGKRIGSVDLSAYADADGIPDVTGLYALGGKVFALVARLEEFKPTDFSTLLVIDGASGQVEETVRLSYTNPSGRLRYNEPLKRLVLIETGGFSSLGGTAALDGIVEYFDPVTRTVSGPVITAKALGGDIIDAVIASETKGYAIIERGADDTLTTELVSFDPSTGEKTKALISSATWAYPSMALTPDGKSLWLADRTRTKPGIRIFDTESDEAVTLEPIDVGLPPFMICFVDADDASDRGGSTLPDSGVDGTAPESGASDETGPEAPPLIMDETIGDEPVIGANACPVPEAGVLTIIAAGTTVTWSVPEDPTASIQIGVTQELAREAPETWIDTASYSFASRHAPYAVKLFARTNRSDCDATHVFSHIYNVADHYPPPPGMPGTTAMPMDDDALVSWATGWVDPVAYGTEVLEEWRTPARAVGPADGTSGDIVCLGDGGEITMSFDIPVKDRTGFDFAVFENGASDGFLDLAFVAVSSDGETFVRFDSAYLGTEPVGAFETHDTTLIGDLAGKYRMGFGQPFDLHALANKPEVLEGRVDLLDIRYIKLIDIPGDGSVVDSFGHPIFDPYPCVESAGFDLDAVGVIHE